MRIEPENPSVVCFKEVIEIDRAALDTFPAILANSFIQQLEAQLADLQRQREVRRT